MKSKKMDQYYQNDVALVEDLYVAYLENLTFEDILVDISIDPGVTLNAAPLAIKSKKTTLKNVIFKEIVINTGMGDDGEALYRLGDLFVQATGTVLDQVTAENIVFKSSEFAEISRLLD